MGRETGDIEKMGKLWRRAPRIALRFISSSSQYGLLAQCNKPHSLRSLDAVLLSPLQSLPSMSLYDLNELCAYPRKTASLRGGLNLTSYLSLRLPVVRRLGDWQYAQALRSSPAGKHGRALSVLCIRLTQPNVVAFHHTN